MITKFNVGEEVYIRAKVISVTADNKGVKYRLRYGDGLSNTYAENEIVSADVADFRRENPSED